MALRALMLMVAAALGAQEPAAAVRLFDQERTACVALIALAIAMGFPALRAARLFDGNLVVRIPETTWYASGISARLPDGRIVVPGLCTVRRNDVGALTSCRP